ncbi:MAG: hypothetical protein COB60_11420 [Flavobacteriaceae bacterium]|nr:MAG: hypothetical protein COB60_11420 [Flavobacteriaceae bacterium]
MVLLKLRELLQYIINCKLVFYIVWLYVVINCLIGFLKIGPCLISCLNYDIKKDAPFGCVFFLMFSSI